MANPNPFYRFKPAWNYGFYPDNDTTTQLLFEIYQVIAIAYPGWVTPGTTTLGQLQGIVSNLVNPYNAYPYYGGMSVIMDAVPAGPVYNWTLIVRNNDLYVVDSTQEITISGTATNPGKVISTSALNAFTIASYSGTYSPTLINEEVKIQEALECVNLNGSAIFPITYKYDPSLGVARSGLARGMDWQLSNGVINRLPIETTPRQNRRTFELPQLTGDDTYVLSIMERIIQGAFTYVDFNTSILPVYNSFTPPDGWTFSYNYPSFTTYERVQFNFVDPSRRKLILVGRRTGSTYLWQRFVSDSYLTAPYDFLSVYTESTQLPYEPNQAGRWLYNNDTYDFEFVDFTSGCYESPEFYPMPAKPGDQLQFNIIDANITGIDDVSIGLFEEDGTFVQKIGDASKLSYACGETTVQGTQYKGQVTIPSKQGCYRFGLYSLTSNGGGGESNCNLTFTKSLTGAEFDSWIEDFVTVMFSGTKRIGWQISQLTPMYIYDGNTYPPPYNPEDIASWCNSNIPGMTATFTQEPNVFTWSWTVNVPCGTTDYSMVNCEVNVLTEDCVNNLWTTASQNCPCSGSGANCNLTFTKSISGTEYDNWIASYVTLMAVGSKRIKWSIPEIPLSYILDGNVVSPPASPTEIADWCNNNIPGMVATYAQQPDVFTWAWTVNVPCGSTAYTMLNCEVNSLTEDCTTTLWTTDAQNCPCSGSGSDSYLYSLSNIINIDRADCFSTILEYWADSNSIAQGNEYYSDWKQRVRIGINGGGEKPIIEESLYRQSNGVHRRPQNKQDLSVDLHTDFFDLETQLAMTDATRHPNLVWEGKSIFVKGDIEVATTQDFTTQTSFETLSQMKFQALIQGFQPRNSSCLTC